MSKTEQISESTQHDCQNDEIDSMARYSKEKAKNKMSPDFFIKLKGAKYHLYNGSNLNF